MHASYQFIAPKYLICDEEKAYTPIVGAYRGVSLFQDSTQSTKVAIAGHALFQPYSADKLVHAPWKLIATGLKQLSVGPSSLVVLESLHRNSDLVMAGRRYLYLVVVDWCRFAVFSSGGLNVAVASQYHTKEMFS